MGQIEEIRKNGFDKEDEHKTVFHTLLQSDLPAKEKETKRLADEAVLLVGAGTHTTSFILAVLTFYLLSNPPLLRKLREEPPHSASGNRQSCSADGIGEASILDRGPEGRFENRPRHSE